MRTKARSRIARIGETELIQVYTDGSSSYKDGNGAWAIIASRPEGSGIVTAERFGFLPVATNITAELTAILRAFEFIRPAKDRSLTIITDSEFSIKALTMWYQAWALHGFVTSQGKPVANVALLQQVHAAWQFHIAAGTWVTFKHVRGHTGVAGNERADTLAGDSRRTKTTRWRLGEDEKIHWNGSTYQNK
jgi:ribonuclease HI